MSICFYLTGKYGKAVDKATQSIQNKKTIKGLYRRGKAYAMKLDYERAIQDMQDAVKMDLSDPNDIQQEIIQLKAKQKEYTRKVNEKMSGFLLKADD